MNLLNIVELIIIVILIILTISLFISKKKLKAYKILILEIIIVLFAGHFTYDVFIKNPDIKIIGDMEITIEAGKKYEDAGAKSDLHGKDISNLISVDNEVDINKVGDYKVHYKLLYKNKLIDQTRTVHVVDKTKPDLKLKGDDTINVPSNSEYEEEGYEAKDNVDGDISKKVKVTKENVNDKQYKLKYTVTDTSGNIATETRTINIVAPIKKVDKNKNGVIYLTFDDGPSFDITPKILDILKEENVKATFFVIHFDKNKEPLIKRIVNEGHSIGIHGNSHKYSVEYKSVDSYMNSVYTIGKEIKNVTGVDSKIIRFPGGSSNTVSKYYSVGIMSKLTKRVLQEGYRYFDWNIPSGDSGDVHTSEEVYKNVTKNLGKSYPNMVLMHDFSSNKKTLNALKDIIEYGKKNGFIFDKITDDTPMITHKVAN